MITRRRLLSSIGAGLALPSTPRLLRAQPIGLAAPILSKPSGPPPYAPQAVHFDGATWLVNAALVSSDNGTASFSGWIKQDANNGTFYAVDPTGDYLSSFANPSGDANIQYWTGAPFLELHNTVFPLTAAFLHVIFSADVRRATPVLTMYLQDVAKGQPTTADPGFDGTSTVPFNGLSFWVGSDSANLFTGDACDWWIAPGVSLLDGGGDIPLATRRKFIDASGKPVYLGANGELPTGTSPAVFLSASAGNAASFATNRGTGGAFTMTGALTLAAGP